MCCIIRSRISYLGRGGVLNLGQAIALRSPWGYTSRPRWPVAGLNLSPCAHCLFYVGSVHQFHQYKACHDWRGFSTKHVVFYWLFPHRGSGPLVGAFTSTARSRRPAPLGVERKAGQSCIFPFTSLCHRVVGVVKAYRSIILISFP